MASVASPDLPYMYTSISIYFFYLTLCSSTAGTLIGSIQTLKGIPGSCPHCSVGCAASSITVLRSMSCLKGLTQSPLPTGSPPQLMVDSHLTKDFHLSTRTHRYLLGHRLHMLGFCQLLFPEPLCFFLRSPTWEHWSKEVPEQEFAG